MPKISVRAASGGRSSEFANPNAPPPERRPLLQVLGQESGASERGSTYYGQLIGCPREFGLAQVAGLRPIVPAEQLTLGILYHYAREAYYDAIFDWQSKLDKPKTPVQREHFFWGNLRAAAQAAMAFVEPIRVEPGYERTWYWLDKCLNAYFEANWKINQWEVIGTEVPVEVKTSEYRYTSRLDLIVYDWNRRGFWIDEAKTARYLTDDLVDSYQQDFQVLGEVFLFERFYGFDKKLLGVNVSIVTKQEESKVTAVECSPSRLHLREFEKTLLAFSDLREVYERLGWPKALGHCAGAKRGYSRCPYYTVCHNHPHMEVDDWIDSDPPEGYQFTGKTNQHEDR